MISVHCVPIKNSLLITVKACPHQKAIGSLLLKGQGRKMFLHAMYLWEVMSRKEVCCSRTWGQYAQSC